MNSTIKQSPNQPPKQGPKRTITEWYLPKNIQDGLFGVAVLLSTLFALVMGGANIDEYDLFVLILAAVGMCLLGWTWRGFQWLSLAVAVASLSAIGLYAGNLKQAETVFWLKYLFSSQSAVLWMNVCFAMATVAYWWTLLRGNLNIKRLETEQSGAMSAGWTGTALMWAALFFGATALMVRWHESYLIGADVGHIPVSNLYEVFILFALITAGFYLYYEARYQTRALGGFVSLVIMAAVAFLVWYTLDRQAHQIQPLVPALQSWWMKIHVPANFIGYGTFSLAAMVAFAYLVKHYAEATSWKTIAPLFIVGMLLAAEPMIFRPSVATKAAIYWAMYFGISACIVGGILLARKRIAAALPDFAVLDDIMYKAIAVGFAFFTVATILGALWAADAWGTYWQWDPKETWALIVWLNYAAWLHLRFLKGMRGVLAAYWALAGLLITGFAFLGVNMFLSGLHSYGTL